MTTQPSTALKRIGLIRVADLEVDALMPRARRGTREIPLTPFEHIVLYLLAANAGTVVTYDELALALGHGTSVRNNTLARHLSTLRQKLTDDADHPRYIETVPGVGARFLITWP